MLPILMGCMMLKDEAHNLHRCLRSIRELCDEIVVVDTGSTDDTVKIAREYGAIVYPGAFNWRKPPIFDFALHRNSGLQYCQELGADWTFTIDGDEELQDIGITPQRFKQRLSQTLPEVHALGCQVHERRNGEFTLSWWGTRFFKVKQGVFYEGIVHNRPKLLGGYAAGTNLVLYHYGYSDPNTMVAKRDRTLRLLDKRIADDPEDYAAWYYKTLTLFGMDRYDDGIETGIHALQMLGAKIDDDYHRLNYFGILYYAIGWAYFRKWYLTDDKEFSDKAYQWWMAGWDKWPEDIDLNYWLCQIAHLGKQWDLVDLHGNAYLKAIEKYKTEVDLPMDKFVNSYDMNDMAIGPRHIHMAGTKSQNVIRAILQEMEQQKAA